MATGPLDQHLLRLTEEATAISDAFAGLQHLPAESLPDALQRADDLLFWTRSRLEETRLLLPQGKTPVVAGQIVGPSCRGELVVELEEPSAPGGWITYTGQPDLALRKGQRVRSIGRSDRPAWILLYARHRVEGPTLRAVEQHPGPHDCVLERTVLWYVDAPATVDPKDAFVRFELRVDGWRCGQWGTFSEAIRVPYL